MHSYLDLLQQEAALLQELEPCPMHELPQQHWCQVFLPLHCWPTLLISKTPTRKPQVNHQEKLQPHFLKKKTSLATIQQNRLSIASRKWHLSYAHPSDKYQQNMNFTNESCPMRLALPHHHSEIWIESPWLHCQIFVTLLVCASQTVPTGHTNATQRI